MGSETLVEAAKQAFGENLRGIRKKAGITQQEVSLRCDMSLRYYQDLEAGNKQPTLTTLFRLSEALSSKPDKLIESAFVIWQKK